VLDIVGSTNSRHFNFFTCLPFVSTLLSPIWTRKVKSKNWSDENSYPPTIRTNENSCLKSKLAPAVRFLEELVNHVPVRAIWPVWAIWLVILLVRLKKFDSRLARVGTWLEALLVELVLFSA
jgi:hypothetical protein